MKQEKNMTEKVNMEKNKVGTNERSTNGLDTTRARRPKGFATP